jgi:hypothetical protein
MFNKFIDLLKEVFWLKPSRPKPKRAGRKKPAVKKKVKASRRKPVVKKIPPKITKPAKAQPKEQGRLPAAGKKTPKTPVIDPSLTEVGIITHYFDRIKVCVVKLTHGTILIGDKLTLIGEKTRFVQKVWSMQIESEDVKVAKKGQIIGLKVDKIVVVGDKVYK